jgi:hypothetical protein
MTKCDICSTLAYTEKHHIVSKSCGGSNAKHNITHICSICHGLVHRGVRVIEGKFMTSDGIKVIWHDIDEDTITGREPEVYVMGKK